MRADQAIGSKLIEMMARAQRAFVQGRFDEAEFNCRLVLGANKKSFEALHFLGLIEFQRGKFEEAHQLIRQALRVNPRSAKAHSNLALALQRLNRLDEALMSLDRALAIEPDFLLALNNRGHILWRLKRSDEALQNLDRALALKPEYVDALCNRGNALVDLHRLDDALVCYDQVLGINPNDALALNNRANVLWALNRRDEAMQSYDRALALSPDDLSILKDRGAALARLKRSEEALACFDSALALKPDDPYFLYKRGSALSDLNRHEEALACLDRAFESAPDDADALGDRGNVLSALQRHAEAIASYDRALTVAPGSAKAHWNRGLALLRMGDFERGWKEFEWRWEVKEASVRQHGFDEQRLWRGEQPIAGKTVLLHAEQGLGDTIQFLRYVPDVAALGAKVIVQVHPELKTLISSIAGADGVIGKSEQVPSFDLHCPLLSLPVAFNTRLESIPAKIPYLSGTSERTASWADRLPKSATPKIGIAWAGNPKHANDRWRSIALPRLMPLLSASGFQFVSIQKDLRDGDLEFLRKQPRLIHLGDQITDFSETAAIMPHLDLVVTVDTAVAHLAGALGRPVWVLLDHTPDWRWMVEREDSPWYPTLPHGYRLRRAASVLFSMRGESMKKIRAQLLATATVVALGSATYAADMGVPMKGPAPAPIPYAGWQGWYLGGSIGAARLNVTGNQTFASLSETGPCSNTLDLDLHSCSTGTTGFTAGVQAGYDWQSRYFVYGVVADWTWTGLKHTVTNNNVAISLPFFQAKVDWLASFRGRMGLALDDTLVYLTGGLALGELKSSAGVLLQCPDECHDDALNKTQVGWVAGAGVEHKLSQNWSIFGEFLYYDLGTATARSTSPSGNAFSTEFTHEIFQGKLGVNFRY